MRIAPVFVGVGPSVAPAVEVADGISLPFACVTGELLDDGVSGRICCCCCFCAAKAVVAYAGAHAETYGGDIGWSTGGLPVVGGAPGGRLLGRPVEDVVEEVAEGAGETACGGNVKKYGESVMDFSSPIEGSRPSVLSAPDMFAEGSVN